MISLIRSIDQTDLGMALVNIVTMYPIITMYSKVRSFFFYRRYQNILLAVCKELHS